MTSVQQDSNPDTKPGITEGSRAWFAARSAAEPSKLWLIDGETRYQLRWPLDGEEYTLTVECDEQLEAARQAWRLLTVLKVNGITTLARLQERLAEGTPVLQATPAATGEAVVTLTIQEKPSGPGSTTTYRTVMITGTAEQVRTAEATYNAATKTAPQVFDPQAFLPWYRGPK